MASISTIIENQLYIGNLESAQSSATLSQHGITHILSVCSDLASSGPAHMIIPVQDSEYEDILIHLPLACDFIQSSFEQGGRVLVHCRMGVSRSATIAAAYLMKTKHINTTESISFIQQRRPQVHPNYGFYRQLEVFTQCEYIPSASNEIYCTWKRNEKRHITSYLNQLHDTIPIIPDKLFMNSALPNDPIQFKYIMLELGIQSILTISPSASSEDYPNRQHMHISDDTKDDLLLALSSACASIANSNGPILVHSLLESRACIVICAYLMYSQHITCKESCNILEKALPLFYPTANITRHLETFESCGYHPTRDHPSVATWSRTSYIHVPDGRLVQRPSEEDLAAAISATAATILSETNISLGGFGEALAGLQKKVSVQG